MPEEIDGIPGTIRLLDNQGRKQVLEHELRLVPEPSSDPHDPLNWARWRKNLHLFCIAT